MMELEIEGQRKCLGLWNLNPDGMIIAVPTQVEKHAR